MIYCIHIKRRENCFCNENKISLIFDELIVGVFTEISVSYGTGKIESKDIEMYYNYNTKYDITNYSLSLNQVFLLT